MIQMTDLFGLELSSATLSPCVICEPVCPVNCTDRQHRPWRYNLVRCWDPSLPKVSWIMLNPSTATADADDPTIRRCVSFAESWGYGGIVVTNLFALRATDPRELATHPDPIGPENDEYLVRESEDAAVTVCAWGAHPMSTRRSREVLTSLYAAGRTPMCLGVTKSGQPRHPLYVKASQPLAGLRM